MSDLNVYEYLNEMADRYIGLGKATLIRGATVLPVAVGVWPDGRTEVAGIAGPCSAAQRAGILRAMAAAGAAGVLFFGDVNVREKDTGVKTGDALQAYLELRDGRSACHFCRYVTTLGIPFFEPVTIATDGTATWLHSIYDRPVH